MEKNICTSCFKQHSAKCIWYHVHKKQQYNMKYVPCSGSSLSHLWYVFEALPDCYVHVANNPKCCSGHVTLPLMTWTLIHYLFFKLHDKSHSFNMFANQTTLLSLNYPAHTKKNTNTTNDRTGTQLRICNLKNTVNRIHLPTRSVWWRVTGMRHLYCNITCAKTIKINKLSLICGG
jgi:hypothetical protein